MSASHSPYLYPVAHQYPSYRPTATQAYQPQAAHEAGRHRRTDSHTSAALDAVSRLGSMVSLSALLVIGGAVGGMTATAPTGGDGAAATAITYDLSPAGEH